MQVAPTYPSAWNEIWYIMDRKVVEIQSRRERCRDEKILVSVPEIKFTVIFDR